MISIVCFDLVPEALEISNIAQVILGVIFGVVCMIICDILVQKKFNLKVKDTKNQNTLLKTGIVVSIGLALHNFPEGLSIGAGFGASISLGYSLALAILLQDIPEGVSMAVPMKNGGMKISKVIFYVILSGITTGVGAFFGASLRNNIRKCNINMSCICSGSNVIYSFRGIDTRI